MRFYSKAVLAVVWTIFGLFLSAGIFPLVNPRSRPRLARHWSSGLLAILGIRVAADPMPDLGGGYHMVVSNHVSWVDIFVLLSVMPIRFVSKAEVRRWPVAGFLASSAGTLFLDRSRKREAAALGPEMQRAIQSGELIGIFPEGTTTDGSIIRPFYSSLIQPAIQIGAALLPTGLLYRSADGQRHTVIPFIGQQSFLQSFIAILRTPGARVEVRFGPTIPTDGLERRELAHRAETEVARLVGLAVDPHWVHPD